MFDRKLYSNYSLREETIFSSKEIFINLQYVWKYKGVYDIIFNINFGKFICILGFTVDRALHFKDRSQSCHCSYCSGYFNKYYLLDL